MLLVGTTVWVATLGLVRLGLAGDEVHLRLAQCQTEGGGREGSYVQCSGQLVGDKSTDTVKIRHDGQQGEVVPAARTPWGAFEVIDTSVTSWATAVPYPVLPLAAAGLTAHFALRAAQRGRKATLTTPARG